MSNMCANITLVTTADRHNLHILKEALEETPENHMYYVHVRHICPTPRHPILTQERSKLVVYSNLFYQDILALVIGDNARILPEDVDETVALDTSPTLIGYCICRQQTQP